MIRNRFYLLDTMPRFAVGSIQSIQWASGMKQPDHEVDHSHPSISEVKNAILSQLSSLHCG